MRSVLRNYKWMILTALVFGVVLSWYALFIEIDSSPDTEVTFLDVGQGDAVLVESPAGVQALIDAGPDNKVLRALSEELPFYDRTIEVVVATHPDADHIGGMPAVFRRYEVEKVVTPGVEKNTDCYSFFGEAVSKEGAQKLIAKAGMKIDLGAGAVMKVLSPDRSFAGKGVDTNVASIISALKYGKTQFLLMGDAPRSVEKYLTLRKGDALSSAVLKVGHHGSDTSSSKALLGFSSPKYGVISVGEDNRYGFPDEEVLNRLKKFGVKTLRTSKRGNIEFVSDGKEVELKAN